MPKEPSHFERIISGGQTGVDRAALDVALELGIPCGGWCPKGRKAEDGLIDPRYPLQETESTSYPVRTERNVKESDGTLILTDGPVTGGTVATVKFAQKHEKPYLMIDLGSGGDLETVRKWEETNKVRILNVAGPRESKIRGIHDKAVKFLRELLRSEDER